MMPMDLYDMREVGEDIIFESESYHEQDLNNLFASETEAITLAMDDINEFVITNHAETFLQGDTSMFE